jgi:hypothetical protein
MVGAVNFPPFYKDVNPACCSLSASVPCKSPRA